VAVYDDPKTDDLNDLTGINQAEENQMDSDAQSGAAQDIADRENLYNPGGDAGDSTDKSVSPGGLAAAEQGSGSSLYNGAKDALPNFRQKLKGGAAKLLKNKLALGLIGSGGGLSLVVILFLVILLSSLKLPNVMTHIEGYEFARLSRQFAQRASATSEESLAMQAADDGALASLKAKYTSGYTSVRDSTWGKLDKYRPNKVMENLGDTNGLKIKYTASGISGRPLFSAMEIDGVNYAIKPVTGAVKFVPGLKQLVEFKNQAAFAKVAAPAVKKALMATDTGPIIRGATARLIRREIGVNLIAWNLENFKDKLGKEKTPQAALLEETRQTATAVDKASTVPDNATTSQIKDGVRDATTAETEVLADDVALQAAVNNGGVAEGVQTAITKNTASSFASDAMDIANPLYAIAVPLCIVYDGSVQHSGPAITNQADQQQALFYHFASAADQQKAGDKTTQDAAPLATAIGATNAQLSNAENSNPEILARGGTINTKTAVTAEAGAGGTYDYSVFNALGMPIDSPGGKIINTITSSSCTALTDLRVAGGVAVVNLAAAIFSLGSAPAVEEGVGISARAVITKFVTTSVKDMFAKKIVTKGVEQIERGALNRGLRFAFKQGIVIGGTYGATELANLIVAGRAAQINSGLTQGVDALNAGHSGANIHVGELERQQLFARSLTKTEVGQSDQTDHTYVASLNQANSFSQRYFATSNADSLVSHLAISFHATANANLLSSMLQISSSLLKPLSYIGTILGMSGVVHAAPDPSTQHYGNVQFGWSNAEEQLIKSDASYTPLENQRLLDDSGLSAGIATDYAFCFGYKYDSSGNGSYDPTDPASDLKPDSESTLGNLLSGGGSEAKIDRDSDGNVIESAAQCSPNNLGINNSKYGPMVFRWRLARSYDTTIQQLTSMQDVTQ